jgi:predicted Zn-dependent peptidase
VIVIEPVVFAGTSISSSAIRKSIKKGDFETANAMLGKDYSLTGTVRPGQGLGGKLGFPTANILPAMGICLPENGVYVTRLCIGDQTVESVTNIGLRPSVPGAVTTPIIETTMLDHDLDLYGKEVQVSFLSMLRKEKKFSSVEDLRVQVQKDILTARTWHMESEQCWKLAKINQIPVYGIKTLRFTGDVISIVFKMPLSKTTASRNSLLARVLSATCRRFPSRPALSKHLDSLYGAGVESQVESAGDVQMISFTADALHTWRGLSYPFQDTVELLFDMISSPDLDENGLFSNEIFLSERLNLINEIQTRENDKTKYALDKCLDLLTAGTAQNTKSYGEISVLQEISLDELSVAYQELMNKSGISIFVAGNIDHRMAERIFQRTRDTFKNNTEPYRLISGKTPQCYRPVPKDEIHHETKEIEQAKVCIAYKGLVPYFSNNTGTASMLNNMLGGDVHSLLFDVVREQMGLAYSVFSAPFRYLSSIILVAGVAPEKTAVAIECMKQQVERLKNNDFDDALFQSALESISYSYRAISDDLHSMVSYYLNASTAGRNVSLQNALSFMKDLTRDKVVEAAKKLEMSVQYTLSQPITGQGDGKGK